VIDIFFALGQFHVDQTAQRQVQAGNNTVSAITGVICVEAGRGMRNVQTTLFKLVAD